MSALTRRLFMCGTKKPLTRKEAKAVIAKIVAKGEPRGSIYQCEYGRHWHITKRGPTPAKKFLKRAESRARLGLMAPGAPRCRLSKRADTQLAKDE